MTPAAAGAGDDLPPGQLAGVHRRFGLPRYAGARPRTDEHPALTVSGAVDRPARLHLADLLVPERRVDQVSDLHCVTTWSARSLSWRGVPFAFVHELVAGEAGVDPSAGWVTFVGLDGFRSCLRLDDAVAGDVLLADRLDGVPLGREFGAPARLIAPRQYGYKSVKHLCGIEYRHRYDPGSAGWMAHPRGRVAEEERSRLVPGRFWRPVWRTALPLVRRRYRDR